MTLNPFHSFSALPDKIVVFRKAQQGQELVKMSGVDPRNQTRGEGTE